MAAGHTLANKPSLLKEKVRTVLERVGIADRADQIAGELSYGHQRILEIAMGLAQDPKLFILDDGVSKDKCQVFRTILTLKNHLNVIKR